VIEYWNGSPALESRLERVEALIGEALGEPAFPLREAVVEAALPSGKLLRPALLITGSLFGKAAESGRVDKLAAAIEILHIATLVHDDIIDEAPIRRGRPSLHARAGVKEAVLTGDWLFSRCFLLAAESAGPENSRGLARLIAAICSAEIEQDLSKYEYLPSRRDCFRRISGKTAALFSLALFAGASEAEAGRRVAQTLRRAGYGIGMAFQVIDDILDFEADESVMRKPVGKDIAEGLCTLPLVYALQGDGARLRNLLPTGREPPEEIAGKAAAAAARTIELGGTEAARSDARRFTARALGEIGKLPPSVARDELAGLAERLFHRSY
jgi:heptaprenyl diphosphate synthase